MARAGAYRRERVGNLRLKRLTLRVKKRVPNGCVGVDFFGIQKNFVPDCLHYPHNALF